MTSFYISAAHKSSGKTTLSIGLCAAIRQRGLSIRAFKKGPDYIDPIWLGQASGQPCHNLDFFTSGHDFIRATFAQASAVCDAILVEGNMGLYDGLSLDGSDSNAAMAKLLGLPVVLVVDCSGTSRGVAPLLVGHQQFDPAVKFSGVILNKVAGTRHETKLREVVEAYTDFPVLGVVHRDNDIRLTERHLGLIPGNEIADETEAVINLLAQRVKESVDIDELLKRGAPINPKLDGLEFPRVEKPENRRLRIAVAMDAAFGFYYPGDIDRFARLGVDLVPFSCIDDARLPADIDGLFLGGGFPETQAEKLSANVSMRQAIAEALQADLPAYAECGGLMYLCRQISYAAQHYPMCGVIQADVSMNKRPQGRGYVILEATQQHPWYRRKTKPTGTIRAHEFHYSSLSKLNEDQAFGYSIQRGTGIDGKNDGIILRNLVASYSHLRSTDLCSWVDDFVSFVEFIKSSR